MENALKNETSPYLLQHKDNPVNWYPWGSEAFERAEQEDKPIFLSIGYSTCHWCHVMAHESFEDAETADLLNKYFISVKVDKEERPDIDSIYMKACMAMNGSGGWPLSVFITPKQQPFFAGTYFPRADFQYLLKQIHMLWHTRRNELLSSVKNIEEALSAEEEGKGEPSEELLRQAFLQLENSFDKKYGGFGNAPKFPSPHNLMFLIDYYRKNGEKTALDMAEKTIAGMYKGGIFDHIGFGFSRYSTDRYFLVPHFEKMLYDNALMIIACVSAFDAANNMLYKEIARKTIQYVFDEMTDINGGFYTAQDADSEGEEGKYYVFDYNEIPALLGEKEGKAFNEYYGISESGNFEGRNIPNLLHNPEPDGRFDKYLSRVYEYRKSRTKLHLDDKILTSVNGLMIAALARAYRVWGDAGYLQASQKACSFIESELAENDTLFVSFINGHRSGIGFLDDYAFYIFALLELYEASFEEKYLIRAERLCKKTINDFYDKENGGFYLYGIENEQLILKPKEVYDGAVPSGNSVMAHNLVLLSQIIGEELFERTAAEQLEFMAGKAEEYPMGYCFYLSALSDYINPPVKIVCALSGEPPQFPADALVRVINGGSSEYPVINGRTTYYVCKNKSCMPPVNNPEEVL